MLVFKKKLSTLCFITQVIEWMRFDSHASLYVCSGSFRYHLENLVVIHGGKTSWRFISASVIEAIDALSSTAKEEEKQKLLKWSSDLKQEREQLEQKVKQLSNSITVSIALQNCCYCSVHGALQATS